MSLEITTTQVAMYIQYKRQQNVQAVPTDLKVREIVREYLRSTFPRNQGEKGLFVFPDEPQEDEGRVLMTLAVTPIFISVCAFISIFF